MTDGAERAKLTEAERAAMTTMCAEWGRPAP